MSGFRETGDGIIDVNAYPVHRPTQPVSINASASSRGPAPAQVTMAAPSSNPEAYIPIDEIEDHILRPNAFSVEDIVSRVNGNTSETAEACSNVCCCLIGCCGCLTLCSDRLFRTGVGQVDLWLDSNKRPLALAPNTWQWRPNFFQEKLGTYDMASDFTFSKAGVAITKIEAGSVYFASLKGKPVMIAGKDRAGWFVTTEPGFSFATSITVENSYINGCRAKLSSSYINFESLHLFSVVPNTVHVVSKFTPGVGNNWQVLPPGSHSFSSPFMKSCAVIPTSIQDVIISEDRISTQDGIVLSNVRAVLSYKINLENVPKLLDLDVSNYKTIIEDWSKRVCLHEIGQTDYQNHSPMQVGEADGTGTSPPVPSNASVLGGRSIGGLPGATPGKLLNDDDDINFRPQLEHNMRRSLEKALTPYGVSVITFAIQSYDPPAALANQVTAALARRTEAQYAYQAAQISNQAVLAAAQVEAQAIRTRAAAVAQAAALTASVPHARQLQILDKQIEIAKAWSGGNARTLVLQGGSAGMGASGSIGVGGDSNGSLPFSSIQEMDRADTAIDGIATSSNAIANKF